MLAGTLQSVAALSSRPPAAEPTPIQIREAFRTLLGNVALGTRLCVLLDDVHLSDPQTWDLIRSLSVGPHGEGTFILACARPHAFFAQPAAAEVFLELEQQDLASHIELEPLPVEAISELVSRTLQTPVNPAEAQALHRSTGGNAFLLVRVLQGLAVDGEVKIDLAGCPPETAFGGVRAWFYRNVSAADDIVSALAVSGDSGILLGDLSRMTGRSLGDLAGQLHELVRTALVSESRRGSLWHYQLAHPLVREAIYAGLGGSLRALTHREFGRALLARGELAQCAAHLIHGADGGDEEVIRIILDALEQADRQGAYQQGLGLLGTLHDLLPRGDARWANVAEALAGWAFHHHVGRNARLAAAALREIELLRPDELPVARRAEVKARLAVLLAWTTGDLPAATKAAEEALELYYLADMTSSALLTRLELAYIYGLAGDIHNMGNLAMAVLKDAAAHDDLTVAESALSTYATTTFFRGHFPEANRAFEGATKMARRSGNANRLARNLMNHAWSLACEGRTAEALRKIDSAKIATPWWHESTLADIESGVRWLAGEYHAAIACLAERDWSGLTLRGGTGIGYLAIAHIESGGADAARRILNIAREAYAGREWFITTDQYKHAVGVLAWYDGDLDEALELLTSASSRLLAIGAPILAVPILLDQAELSYEIGIPDAAHGAALALRNVAGKSDRCLFSAVADLAEAFAELSSASGSNRAFECAISARDALDEAGLPHLYGRAMRAVALSTMRRNPSRATDALGESAAAFHSCGATWRRDRVVELLQQTGATGRRAATLMLGPEKLTPREVEVARLAARRLPAREIAAMLFVSKRTVESHIASVYSKLGVHSKAELATILKHHDGSDLASGRAGIRASASIDHR